MPLFPPVQPKKPNQAKIDWDLPSFRKAVWNRGQEVTWEMAAKCPCRQFVVNDATRLDENLGHGRVDCPECKGSGVLYHSSQTIVAIPFALARQPQAFANWGQSAFGGCAFTTLPENRPSFLDRLTLQKSVFAYNEVRVRRNETEAMRYPIVTRTIQIASDVDPTEPQDLSLGVVYCRAADSNGRVQGPELVEDTDFTLNVDGTLTWIAGSNAPAPQGFYTISYYGHPVYVVHEMGYSVRDTYVVFKQETPAFKENVTATTMAWLEILGVPGWPAG